MMETDRNRIHVQFGGKSEPGIGRYIWGTLLLLAGVAMLLDAFNVVELWDFVWQYWPSALIVAALTQLATRKHGGITGPLILLSVGTILQLSKLGYIPGGFWSVFWPTILIIWGISILTKNTRHAKTPFVHNPNEINQGKPISNDTIDTNAIFSGDELFVTSNNFSGGQITAVFGGVDADLRNAEIQPGVTAMLKLTAVFGGIEIRVPAHWNIIVRKNPVLGAIEDKTPLYSKATSQSPTLIIDATAFMGGIEIKS